MTTDSSEDKHSSSLVPETTFDHVAVAVEDEKEILRRLVGDFGATELYGGTATGFRWVLLWLGNIREGMFVEILVPWRTEQDDFLRRFLSHRGEGAHHITFRVSDLGWTMQALRDAGYESIRTDDDDARWKETYIHPRQAHGTLIQIVETTIQRPPIAELLNTARRANGRAELRNLAGGFGAGEVWWSPTPGRPSEAVSGHRVALATKDLDGALPLFRDVLGGRVQDQGPEGIELVWPGGGIILESASGTNGIRSIHCIGKKTLSEVIGGVHFRNLHESPLGANASVRKREI